MKTIVILLTLLVFFDTSGAPRSYDLWLHSWIENTIRTRDIDEDSIATFKLENEDFDKNGLDCLSKFINEALTGLNEDQYIEIPKGCRDILQFLILCTDMKSAGIYLPVNDYNLYQETINYVEAFGPRPEELTL